MIAEQEWEHADKGENNPDGGDDDVAIFASHRFAGISAQQHAHASHEQGYQDGQGELFRPLIVYPADELAQGQESCLDEEEESHEACYESPVEHLTN